MGKEITIDADSFLTFGNKDMHEAEILTLKQGKLAVFSRSSPESSRPNEDRTAVFQLHEGLILIVADGVGGYGEGDVAAQIAVNELKASIKSIKQTDQELREAILKGIDKANNSIINKTTGAATTITIVELHNNIIRVYHAGDTEVLVTGQKGKVKYQTLAHSPVSYAIEAGFLDEEQAIMHEERHIVSNVLGYPDMHISIGAPVELAPRDTLLIGSDGIFDNLHKEEIIEIIRKDTLKKCSSIFINMITERMLKEKTNRPSKADDMTFILFRLNK